MKQYSPPRLTTKSGSPVRRRRIGRFGMVNSAAVLNADQRVPLGGRADELAVVDPLPLDELELPVQVRADEGEHQPAVGAVVLQHAGGQRRAVVGAAADHPVQPDLAGDDRVARVHPPGVRADRALQSPRVVAVHEGVVARGVGAQLGVVLVRGQGQRRAAGPAPDELGREQLLLGRVGGVLVQVAAEGGDALVQLAEGHVGAVAAEHVRLRDRGQVAVLVLVAEDELTGPQRCLVRVAAEDAGALYGRLADAVLEPELLAPVRGHVHVQRPDGA